MRERFYSAGYLASVAAFGVALIAGCGGGSGGSGNGSGNGNGGGNNGSGVPEPPAGSVMRVKSINNSVAAINRPSGNQISIEFVPFKYNAEVADLRLGANGEYPFTNGRITRNTTNTDGRIPFSPTYDPSTPVGVPLPIIIVTQDGARSTATNAATFTWLPAL